MPAVWSACTVYVNLALKETVGEIADYNFTDYTNYIGQTVYHKTATEPLFIDLSFYSKRANLPPNQPIIAAQIVTVHFETESGRSGGISGMPLIGEDTAVRGYVNQSKSALAVTALVAIIAFAIFCFLCFLKHSLSFLPQQFVVFGVFGTLLSGYLLSLPTNFPYVWAALGNLFLYLIPLAAILSFKLKIKKFPIWIPFLAFVCIHCVVMCLSPLFLASASFALFVWQVVAAVGLFAMLAVLILVAVLRKTTDTASLICATFAAILPLSVLFTGSLSVISDPSFWLLVGLLAVSIYLSFYTFKELERKNRSLTANLQAEVGRQTTDLQRMLGERDNLLRHVSHDMKKPLHSVSLFLSTLREREHDTEQLKTIGIINQKTDELLKGFDELCGYAKLNYAIEPSKEFDVFAVVDQCFKALNADCIASGIVFNVVASSILVYGKPGCLLSVLKNIVINALEHSNCKTITISSYKKKGFCHVDITDDGDGIAENKNLFQPYYSDNHSSENVGLGLYICKSLMTSMGGDLSYFMQNGTLTFTVTLPLV